jgi:cell division protein FtsW
MVRKLVKYDQIIMLLVIALTCIGLVMVYSSSALLALKRHDDSFYFLERQLAFACAGFAVMLVVMQIDYHVWKKMAVWALLGSLVLLGIVLIPGLGSRVGGSYRWINLTHGLRFQPSEFVKMALIIYMAYSLDRKQEKVRLLGSGFISYMIVLVILLALLLKQPDLGSAVTLFLVAFAMLFAAGTRLSYILSVILLSLPILYHLIASVEYRKRRFLAFLDPWQYPRDAGYQLIQSFFALGPGGFWGRGLGSGRQKLFFLPEAHTDFIMAVIGEELGFIGLVVIIAMFALLVQRALSISMAAPDTFGRFLALGIAVLIGIESVFNMAVVTGLLPTKGLALPFISYGGSSLIVTLFAMGILLNISSFSRYRETSESHDRT